MPIPTLKRNQLFRVNGVVCRVRYTRAESEGYLDGKRYMVELEPIRPSQYGKLQHAHDLFLKAQNFGS